MIEAIKKHQVKIVAVMFFAAFYLYFCDEKEMVLFDLSGDIKPVYNYVSSDVDEDILMKNMTRKVGVKVNITVPEGLKKEEVIYNMKLAANAVFKLDKDFLWISVYAYKEGEKKFDEVTAGSINIYFKPETRNELENVSDFLVDAYFKK